MEMTRLLVIDDQMSDVNIATDVTTHRIGMTHE